MNEQQLEEIAICLWRKITEQDLISLQYNYDIITLSKNKPCYNCNGKNKKCGNYVGYISKYK